MHTHIWVKTQKAKKKTTKKGNKEERNRGRKEDTLLSM